MLLRKTCESLAEFWKAIAAEELAGVYLFEIMDFPELETAVGIFKTIFESMNGYFTDCTRPTAVLDFAEGCDLSFAESFSRKFPLGRDIGFRGFSYKKEKADSETRTMSYLVDFESGDGTDVSNTQRVSDLSQTATPLIASLLAMPAIGRALGKKVVAILFEEHFIDYSNLELLLQYFSLLKDKKEFADMRIYLLAVSEPSSKNEAFFGSYIQRVGVLKDQAFMRVNPYNACLKTIETISGGITKETPFVLFFGAGASAEAKTESNLGLPLGDDLKKIAIKSVLNRPELENESLQILVDKFKHWLRDSRHLHTEKGENFENVKVTLERVLQEELQLVDPSNSKTLNLLDAMSQKAQPPVGYANVRRIIEAKYRPILITTNYDTLLERVLGKYVELCTKTDFAGKKQELVSYIKGQNEKIPVLKIHGSLSNRRTIKESVENIHRFPDEMNQLIHSIYAGEINKEFGERNVQTFIIGYAFRDIDVIDFFSYPEVFTKTTLYMVNPSPSIETIDFLLKNRVSIDDFMLRNISMPFSKFTQALLSQLEQNK